MKNVRDIKPFGVRMDDDLKAWVADSAKRNGRSMNSEIVQILKEKKAGKPDMTAVRKAWTE